MGQNHSSPPLANQFRSTLETGGDWRPTELTYRKKGPLGSQAGLQKMTCAGSGFRTPRLKPSCLSLRRDHIWSLQSLPASWFIALAPTGHGPGATSMLITGESEMQRAPAMAQPQGAKVKNGAVLNHGSNMPDLLAGGWGVFLGKPTLTRKFIFFWMIISTIF